MVLVIAYGNPLRCDDGLAWHAAEALWGQPSLSDVEIITRHQLTPELAPLVSQASYVVFLDAAHVGVTGEIVSTPLKPDSQSSVFTHDFLPHTILALAETLYGRCPPATLLSLCGECFDHGKRLSAAVRNALPELVARVNQLVRENG